jgi:hypothetical protein
MRKTENLDNIFCHSSIVPNQKTFDVAIEGASNSERKEISYLLKIVESPRNLNIIILNTIVSPLFIQLTKNGSH